jgi:3,4-dihydroxy 2-butanone 4-phosphate synthase/3,4-dihydroxy 2-butanone 4-phosphate synthase/GTP cyclohydrolase II
LEDLAVFTGRVAEVGTVVEAGGRLLVEAPKTAGGLVPGASVCVSGVCLSVVAVDGDRFRVDVVAETARRATAAGWGLGQRVNLELPLRVGDPLDGHLVQGHVDAIGKVTRVDTDGGGRRVWIRPPRRLLDEIVAKGSVAVDGVSLTVAEVVRDRFSVALIPLTLAGTTLADLVEDQRVNLESDLVVKAAGEVREAARLVVHRTFAALPWAGEPGGPAGVEKAAAQLAAGGGVVIFDPHLEGEADVVFAGAVMRPEAFVFLLTQACGHTTVPCDRARLERLEIPPMPGGGDRHGTAFHVSVDLAAGDGTGVSAQDRAATVRRLAHPGARPDDFLRPGHVFPLAGRPGGLAERQGHTEASLALCEAAGLPTVAAICEIMGPDGHMLGAGAAERFALRWELPMVNVDELVRHL